MAEQIPQTVQFQEALEMYRSGRAPQKKDVAVGAGMRASTFVHHSLGWRRSVEEYGKLRRLLTGGGYWLYTDGGRVATLDIRLPYGFDYPTYSLVQEGARVARGGWRRGETLGRFEIAESKRPGYRRPEVD